MSLCLPEQKLGSHSAEGSSSNKFMLKGRQTGSLHRGHSWVFRAESWDTMQAWVSDIQALTEKTPQERNAFVRRHARSISGSSQKAASVSSDGLMDEDDEEPFTATPSSVTVQTPRQDVLPRRPQPGGRFPSDLKIDADRGLPPPVSPSSGSSGFGDVRDHGVSAATGARPHSSIGQHYAEDDSPSHAAVVNQYATEDGVNPYTGESTVPGAVAGAVGSEAYSQYGEPNAYDDLRNPQQQSEKLAALESSTIAARDTFQYRAEQQAAVEATTIAADDAPAPTAVPLNPGFTPTDISTSGPSTIGKDFVNGVASEEAIVGAQAQAAPAPLNPKSGSLADASVSRPPHAGARNGSVQSISHFHIPGEFPKSSGS
jgi:hypothetical protein